MKILIVLVVQVAVTVLLNLPTGPLYETTATAVLGLWGATVVAFIVQAVLVWRSGRGDALMRGMRAVALALVTSIAGFAVANILIEVIFQRMVQSDTIEMIDRQ